VNGAKQHEGRFAAEATIGTRWRVIDKAGSVTINDGRLILREQSGEVVAEGPMNEVWANVSPLSGGVATVVWISGERYYIRPPERGNPRSVIKAGRDLKAGKELRKEFLEVVESEGGHIGKP
jgi:hypothetical protein